MSNNVTTSNRPLPQKEKARKSPKDKKKQEEQADKADVKAAAKAEREKKQADAKSVKEEEKATKEKKKAVEEKDAQELLSTCATILQSTHSNMDDARYQVGDALLEHLYSNDLELATSHKPNKPGVSIRKLAGHPDVDYSQAQINRLTNVAVQRWELKSVPELEQLSFSLQAALTSVRDDDPKKQRERKTNWIDTIVSVKPMMSVRKFQKALAKEKNPKATDPIAPYRTVLDKCTKWDVEAIKELTNTDKTAVLDVIENITSLMTDLKSALSTVNTTSDLNLVTPTKNVGEQNSEVHYA